MQIFFFRLFFILTIIFLEFSFFDILFPTTPAPLVLLTGVVVWVLLSGFTQALFMIIPLAILFDIIATGMPGTLTLYALLLAYTTSFLSRRLLVEHQGVGMFLYALFSAIGAFGYMVFHFLLLRPSDFFGFPEIFFGLWSVFSFSNILFVSAWSVPLFFFVYIGIRRFEHYAGTMSRNDFLNVK